MKKTLKIIFPLIIVIILSTRYLYSAVDDNTENNTTAASQGEDRAGQNSENNTGDNGNRVYYEEVPNLADTVYLIKDPDVKKNMLIGIKVGIGISTMYPMFGGQDGGTNKHIAAAFAVGLRFGYFFANNLGLIVDVEWHKRGAKFSDEIVHLNYVDFNLMFALKRKEFVFGAGLYFGLLGTAVYVKNSGKIDVKNNFNVTDFGITFTTGVIIIQYIKFFCGIEFKLGLIDNISYALITPDEKLANLSLMFIFGFGV